MASTGDQRRIRIRHREQSVTLDAGVFASGGPGIAFISWRSDSSLGWGGAIKNQKDRTKIHYFDAGNAILWYPKCRELHPSI
jgi:hypothetical protein